ncbi:hypothetical protein ATANTOWER_009035, partial [Ataeniobius toweri]|nr:hypothetical protein [Ataeniobius toweri]
HDRKNEIPGERKTTSTSADCVRNVGNGPVYWIFFSALMSRDRDPLTYLNRDWLIVSPSQDFFYHLPWI